MKIKIIKGIYRVIDYENAGINFTRFAVAAIVEVNGWRTIATAPIDVQLDDKGFGFTASISMVKHFDDLYGMPESTALSDLLIGRFAKWREGYVRKCERLNAAPTDNYARLIPYYLQNKWKFEEAWDWDEAYEQLQKEV